MDTIKINMGNVSKLLIALINDEKVFSLLSWVKSISPKAEVS